MFWLSFKKTIILTGIHSVAQKKRGAYLVMICQNAKQKLIFIMFCSNWILKIAIDPAKFREKCLFQ